MKLNSNETAVRVEGGWNVFDREDAKWPIAVIADSVNSLEINRPLMDNSTRLDVAKIRSGRWMIQGTAPVVKAAK